MQKIPHKFKVLRKQHSMILINPVTTEKIPLCRHLKLAVLGRWPLLRGDCDGSTLIMTIQWNGSSIEESHVFGFCSFWVP